MTVGGQLSENASKHSAASRFPARTSHIHPELVIVLWHFCGNVRRARALQCKTFTGTEQSWVYIHCIASDATYVDPVTNTSLPEPPSCTLDAHTSQASWHAACTADSPCQTATSTLPTSALLFVVTSCLRQLSLKKLGSVSIASLQPPHTWILSPTPESPGLPPVPSMHKSHRQPDMRLV